MTRFTKTKRARRTEQNEAVARIQAAWQASVPAARAKEHDQAVAQALARGPAQPRPDMPKGTMPNPPRPGREPKVKKVDTRSRKRF